MLCRATTLYGFRHPEQTKLVMAGLVPAIHVFFSALKTWMPATSAGMTASQNQCHLF
jgi:hypothetical protein